MREHVPPTKVLPNGIHAAHFCAGIRRRGFQAGHLLTLIVATLLPATGCAMEIQWTRMAGQWPVEASPVVADITYSGKSGIIVLNQGGQLMLWTADGASTGPGQDGVVAQLPEGRWTTTPELIEAKTGTRLVVASVEGLIVGLNEKFQLVWQHKLPGETGWGRATPARLRAGSETGFAFGDGTGTVSFLDPTGKVVWTNLLGAGPIKAPPQTFANHPTGEKLLVASGSTLFSIDPSGQVSWRRDLGAEIQTRPEVLLLPDRKLIVCGTSSGSLFAVGMDGKIVWECAVGEPLNHHIVFLPRLETTPLILCAGIWGNLHAIDVTGRPAWTQLFRTKTRARPLVMDTDGDGHREVYLPTFHQHVYAFDDKGSLVDDLRLSGILPSALTPIVDSASGRTDFLVTTTTLLAHRLRPSQPKSPYGKTGEARDVHLTRLPAGHADESAVLAVQNPRGALINVNLQMTDTNGWTRVVSSLTSRSAFQIPLPSETRNGKWTLRATAKDSDGRLLAGEILQLASEPQPTLPDTVRAWPTDPYGSFSESRLAPFTVEADREQKVTVPNLYQDEFDQGAFIIASTRTETVRARVALGKLLNANGVAFGGTILVREVVATGSVNGERVPDALPQLGEAGLVTISPRRSTKLWLSVATHGAAPGVYTGNISIAPINETNTINLPLVIEVLNLRLPREFPLTFCTWDYVPNRWFPDRSKEVLDDMARHGVNVFPRSTIPSARCDAAGKLTIDWTALDAELDRLHGRGKILFHLNRPPISFAAKPSEADKRLQELAYIRELRDHLRARGRGYEDYAFYLLDEPGLDYGGNIHILLDAGQLFREADPKLLTYTDPVAGLSWKDFERIEPLVDVWAPNMRLVTGLLSGDPRMKRIMSAKTVWSYECVSQVKSLSPLRYNRANAWRAKYFGLAGIGFWTHSTTEVDHWFAGKTFNDEYALVYPGELPVPSIRWEGARDGLEDVSAMTRLEEAIRRHRQSATRRDLVKKAEETLRIALRDVMEMSDDVFLESRDFLREGDRVLDHTWSEVEAFRRHRAEIARLTLALNEE